MKVTILTVYSKPNIVDKIEKLILSMNTQEPQTFTELNIDKGEGNLTAEWFHPDLGDKNLDYREQLYGKIRSILPESNLAIIEDEESQEIMTIGDLSYFKNIIKKSQNLQQLAEIQERIDQTEIGNPLLKTILNKSYQDRLNSFHTSA